MGGKGKEAAQRLIAILIIMAMLSVMGIPMTVIIFFATVVYFVWRAVQRSEQQDIKSIFDFYIAANDILRDEEKRWYGFEVNQIIDRGVAILHGMQDPPPLVYFTLGALYNRAGNYEEAATHLSYVLENEQGDERNRLHPSPELRRYVQVLRRLESEPAEAPKTMAAIRSLDRVRRTRAAAILEESRERLSAAAVAATVAASTVAKAAAPISIDGEKSTVAMPASSDDPLSNAFGGARQSVLTMPTIQTMPPPPPPPIAEVLRDVYEEEKKTA